MATAFAGVLEDFGLTEKVAWNKILPVTARITEATHRYWVLPATMLRTTML